MLRLVDKKCHSDEDSPAESVMHGALFIKHLKLSAGSYKTLDLLGMSILMKWVLSMRDIIAGYTVSAVSCLFTVERKSLLFFPPFLFVNINKYKQRAHIPIATCYLCKSVAFKSALFFVKKL